MDVDTMRIRELAGRELGEREVELRTDDTELVGELEDRLERLRRLEERDRRLAGEGHDVQFRSGEDASLDAIIAGGSRKAVDLIAPIRELGEQERAAKAEVAFETRLREVVLGSDREPVNRRERRALEQRRDRAMRRLR